MDNLDILELQNRIELLKEKQNLSFNKLSIALGKLNEEHAKEVLPIYSDIKQMQIMLESGNLEEKTIENIKAKYGTETHK
jgi:hypothetical protein